MEQNQKEKLELDLAQTLTEGEMKRQNPDATALDRLSPRYEIRVRTERDPIVEETKLIRGVVREVDDRYDAYVAPETSIPNDRKNIVRDS